LLVGGMKLGLAGVEEVDTKRIWLQIELASDVMRR